MGRLLTDNGLAKTAIDMLASTETGRRSTAPQGIPHGPTRRLRVMIFDSPKWRDHYQMEPTATLDAPQQHWKPCRLTPCRRNAAPMGGRAN